MGYDRYESGFVTSPMWSGNSGKDLDTKGLDNEITDSAYRSVSRGSTARNRVRAATTERTQGDRNSTPGNIATCASGN